MLNDRSILVTGGTGSFGRAFVRRALTDYTPRRIAVMSRDEEKQRVFAAELGQDGFGSNDVVRFWIGDVRDRDRLELAMGDVDIVIHAAALKQVPTMEYNPTEAVLTNVMGANNVVHAALKTDVQKVVALSTDKVSGAINLYGGTKFVAERLFIAANAYSGKRPVRFSCVRYGNVAGSRGSVIPVWREAIDAGKPLKITDHRMTRFWITLDQAVDLVLSTLERMEGGEVFIPKIPSFKIIDLAKAMGTAHITTGIRAGEKIHESLISADEAAWAHNLGSVYVLAPHGGQSVVTRVPTGFSYTSDTNDRWLSVDGLRDQLAHI